MDIPSVMAMSTDVSCGESRGRPGGRSGGRSGGRLGGRTGVRFGVGGSPVLSGPRLAALALALGEVERGCAVSDRLLLDPVGVVRRYRDPLELELVGLLASSLAFGNVRLIRGAVEEVLVRLGGDLLGVVGDRGCVLGRLGGFRYRMVSGEDVARLLYGARCVQREGGSLGAVFASEYGSSGDLRGALSGWVGRIRGRAGFGGGGDEGRRGPGHVLSDPGGGSGCKRLMLYLRWMVRRDDGVDLGVWGGMSPSVLLMPVDTHVLRVSRNLGMTGRGVASWGASEDITGVLRLIDPLDPVRYDFALCHFGMSGGCPSRPGEVACEGCVARVVCLWSGGGEVGG